MEFTLPLTIKIMPAPESRDAPFVAYCPELDIASCGPTEEKARLMLKEAIEIILKDAKKRGILDEYLESVGFVVDKKKRQITFPKVSYEPFYFPVPKFLERKFVCLA